MPRIFSAAQDAKGNRDKAAVESAITEIERPAEGETIAWSPVKGSEPPSPSQRAALATDPPGTSRLQAAALREMSSAPEPDSPSSAHRDGVFPGFPSLSWWRVTKTTHRSMPLPSDSPATAAALRSVSSTTLESLAESP